MVWRASASSEPTLQCALVVCVRERSKRKESQGGLNPGGTHGKSLGQGTWNAVPRHAHHPFLKTGVTAQ